MSCADHASVAWTSGDEFHTNSSTANQLFCQGLSWQDGQLDSIMRCWRQWHNVAQHLLRTLPAVLRCFQESLAPA